MILPEHRKYMVELEMHEERFMERPVHDEDKLQEMSVVLSEAIMESRVVSLRLYDQYGAQSVSIVPKGIDTSTRTLKGLSALGERKIKVPLDGATNGGHSHGKSESDDRVPGVSVGSKS